MDTQLIPKLLRKKKVARQQMMQLSQAAGIWLHLQLQQMFV